MSLSPCRLIRRLAARTRQLAGRYGFDAIDDVNALMRNAAPEAAAQGGAPDAAPNPAPAE